MKNSLLISLLTATAFSSFADPAVKNVQVNFHNDTAHSIEFISFDSSRILASTQFGEESIEPYVSVDNAIFVTSFDNEPMSAGVNALINGEPMKFMWHVNMGIDSPDAPKFHICGVIKDSPDQMDYEYCHIPYVVGNTLMVDFNIQ